MKAALISLLLLCCLFGCRPIKPGQEITSPTAKVKVKVDLDASGRPFYLAYFQDRLVIDTSYLGLELTHELDLREGFQVIGTQTTEFDETWEQPWGEEQFIRNHYRELRVSLAETSNQGRQMDLCFRVYDDGIGFRYEFPEQKGLQNLEILHELTEFHMVADHEAWWIPAFEGNRYEYLYQNTPLSEMGKVHTPVTFQTEEGVCISLHEAALSGYSSMVVDATDGKRLKAELVPYSTDKESRAFLAAPGHTPWRTLQLAETPGDLITSYLILNLNEPNQLGDVSWVEPGKYVGIWWEMHVGEGTWASGEKHAATTENTRRYIDFAAEHSFDGVLVEGWNEGWDGDWVNNGALFSFTRAYPDYDLQSLSDYARSRGVYLVGHHETSGNVDNYERQMEEAYAMLGEHGIKAVKTGYVEHGNILSNGKYHHGQSYVEHFNKVIQLAAKHKVAILAHEPIKDTGERRTYPNIVSREGARGQEFNAWAEDGGNPPDHQTILPFTRCLAGPMDFTPGVFDIRIPTRPNNQVNTTLAKQLALYVTIYSPMQMACDMPQSYERYPDAFEFIKEVGVDWETTKVLDAEIGAHLSIARKERGTGDWFVGAVTNEEARDIEVPLDFLESGKTYTAKVYRDAPDAHYLTQPEAYVIERFEVSAQDVIPVYLAPSGGVAISLQQVHEDIASGQ